MRELFKRTYICTYMRKRRISPGVTWSCGKLNKPLGSENHKSVGTSHCPKMRVNDLENL